ncbi:hypothetical protein V2J09_013635 [Rumex salicifolius]
MSGKRCTVEYDGASKGNPGKSGGGAVIRSDDGTTIRVREGFGHGTSNAAEYKALNRGLEVARQHGFEHVAVRGDSELVHRQITGEYQTRNPNLQNLQRETTSLRNEFKSFTSEHVSRGYNRDADREANRGANLGEGRYEVDYD